MNNSESNSLEAGVSSTFRSIQEGATRQLEACEKCVRESPRDALLWAVAVGYFLRMLPLTALLAFFVRILVALVRPAALIFGAAKLYETFQTQNLDGSDTQESP